MQFAGRSVALDTSAGIWLAESALSAKPDTVAALVPIIEGLLGRGFTFVPVDRLLAARPAANLAGRV